MAILQNALKITIDNQEPVYLASLNTHDFRAFALPNGQFVAVDGGPSYIRRVGGNAPNAKIEEYSLDINDDFDKICDMLLWGTRGEDGKQPLKFVRLADCSVEHLKAILKYRGEGGLYGRVIKSLLCQKETKR